MKVSIIGGAGRVGSSAAYALQLGGIVSEILVSDIAEDAAWGEALDLLHGGALLSDSRIEFGTIADAAKADIIIITAGHRRKPDESRLDLINRNVALFLSILEQLSSAGPSANAILLVVSNPVDILTHLANQHGGFQPSRIIGLGTLLDTSRFCSLIAAEIKVAPTQVNALILGEHGDSMVAIWSSATCNGLPLQKHPHLTQVAKNNLFERTKRSGAEMIRLKGGAGWAVGAAVATLAHAVVLDKKKILPVSSMLQGAYGFRDISMSVPTMIGSAGVCGHPEFELWPRELQALRNSANFLRETISKLTL